MRGRRLLQEPSLSLVRDPAARFPDRLHTMSRDLAQPFLRTLPGNFVTVKLSL